MIKENIIATNAFEGFRTETGFLIEEKNAAYLKTGLLILILGLVCASFSFLVAEIPIKKVLVSILNYSLFYGGLLAIFSGLVYVLMSSNIIKPKRIELDGENRLLHHGRRQISFDAIEGFSCEINTVLGKRIGKVKFKEKGINSLLVVPPIIIHDKSEELRKFVEELNQLLRKEDHSEGVE